jgi:hypothetical protein
MACPFRSTASSVATGTIWAAPSPGIEFHLGTRSRFCRNAVAPQWRRKQELGAGDDVTERWVRPIARLPHDEQLTAVAVRLDLGSKEDCG